MDFFSRIPRPFDISLTFHKICSFLWPTEIVELLHVSQRVNLNLFNYLDRDELITLLHCSNDNLNAIKEYIFEKGYLKYLQYFEKKILSNKSSYYCPQITIPITETWWLRKHADNWLYQRDVFEMPIVIIPGDKIRSICKYCRCEECTKKADAAISNYCSNNCKQM